MKKTAKRILLLALAGLLCLSLAAPALAAGGKIINYSLYTEIVAKINGHVIRSFNIDGYTAVVAEDLRGYGFYALWNPTERTLSVVRATNSDGSLQYPYKWAEYDPGELTHPIGSKAFPIYETDIKTYVAGEEVPAFNKDGETLIWIEDLAPYGDVVWHEKERYIELTLGDPVTIALNPRIKNLEAWKSTGGAGSSYEIYDAGFGKLYVETYTGTPHGSQTNMIFVKNSGEQISINDLMPAYPLGAGYYLRPTNIRFEGYRLIFNTPVLEAVGDDPLSATVKEWGTTQCTVDLLNGKMISMVPVDSALENWSVNIRPEKANVNKNNGVNVTLEKSDYEVAATSGAYPSEKMTLQFNQNGITIQHEIGMVDGSGFLSTTYGKIFDELMKLDLPGVATTADHTNTQAQRDSVAKQFLVTLNGQQVTGNFYWGQGNNHIDYCFDFDQPVFFSDGDVLVLQMPGK